jgi:hypothetical protein
MTNHRGRIRGLFYFRIMNLKFSAMLILTLVLFACQKQADITRRLTPGMDNAKAFQWMTAHAFLPMAESIRDWPNSRGAAPQLTLTDSGIWFDYKTGVVGPDKLMRKGKCLIKNGYSSTGFNDSCELMAWPQDSFGIVSNAGYVYFTGVIKVISTDIYQLTVRGNGEFKRFNEVYKAVWDATAVLDPEGITGRSASFKTTWNAAFTLSGSRFTYTNVIRNKDCFPYLVGGYGESSQNEQNAKIDFNPFGNFACDPVAKVYSGRDEMLLDLW